MLADYPARLVSAVVVPVNVENDSNGSFFCNLLTRYTYYTMYCIFFYLQCFIYFKYIIPEPGTDLPNQEK